MWRFRCGMEEILERQLLTRGRAFATISAIEKALACRKKSFHGSHATCGPCVVQACFSSFTWFVHQMCTSKLLPWCSYDLKDFLFSCTCDFLAIFFLVFYLKWVQVCVGVCIRGPNIRLLEYATCSKWFYMIFWEILQFPWVQVRRAFHIYTLLSRWNDLFCILLSNRLHLMPSLSNCFGFSDNEPGWGWSGNAAS